MILLTSVNAPNYTRETPKVPENARLPAARGHHVGITCRCGAQWTGTARSHCSGCHQLFSGITAFDEHRRHGQCLDPSGLTPPQELIDGVWRYPLDEQGKAYFAARKAARIAAQQADLTG